MTDQLKDLLEISMAWRAVVVYCDAQPLFCSGPELLTQCEAGDVSERNSSFRVGHLRHCWLGCIFGEVWVPA